jgi:hypothetical protein
MDERFTVRNFVNREKLQRLGDRQRNFAETEGRAEVCIKSEGFAALSASELLRLTKEREGVGVTKV